MTLPRADRPAQPTFGVAVAEHHDPERHGDDGNEVGDGRCGGRADVADQCVVQQVGHAGAEGAQCEHAGYDPACTNDTPHQTCAPTNATQPASPPPQPPCQGASTVSTPRKPSTSPVARAAFGRSSGSATMAISSVSSGVLAL